MNFRSFKIALLLTVLVGIGGLLSLAQIPKNVSAKGINLPYFEGTHLKSFFIAQTADPVPGGRGYIFAKEFQMFTFGPGGTNDVEVIIKAPECIFDYDNKRAWSDGSLKAFNASTNYFIEGEGFIVERTKTGSTLIISNKVHTTIQREDTTAKKMLPPIHIYSDYLYFRSEEAEGADKRLANYKGNVRVDDPEMQLTSGALRIIIPSGTNRVQDIVARENVKIRSKADGSEATGQYAVYSSDQTNEIVTLTGKPIWRDAQNEGRAEQLIFDRKNNLVFALTNAELKMPRSSIGSTDFIQADSKPNVATNGFVQVTAQSFEISLPTTNRPSRSLIAKTNVVISSPADKMHATANTAMFDDATGILRLRENAIWQSDQTIAKAKNITVDRTNRTFRAERNASLKLPANNSTNQFIYIQSEKYLLQTNVSFFEDGVRAEFPDGKAPSFLTCNTLEILMQSNQVKTIIAKGGVQLTQTISKESSRSLVCEEMTIQRSIATGTIESLFALRKVSLIEKEPKLEKKLTANMVTMNFGVTNQLESMLAEEQVKIEQGESWATGEQALYIYKEDVQMFEITGQPLARKAETDAAGKTSSYFIRNADVLRWDPKTGEFKASGPWEIDPE